MALKFIIDIRDAYFVMRDDNGVPYKAPICFRADLRGIESHGYVQPAYIASIRTTVCVTDFYDEVRQTNGVFSTDVKLSTFVDGVFVLNASDLDSPRNRPIVIPSLAVDLKVTHKISMSTQFNKVPNSVLNYSWDLLQNGISIKKNLLAREVWVPNTVNPNGDSW